MILAGDFNLYIDSLYPNKKANIFLNVTYLLIWCNMLKVQPITVDLIFTLGCRSLELKDFISDL